MIWLIILTFPDVESSVDSREMKRPRLDTGKDIFTQMTSVLEVITPRVAKGNDQVVSMETSMINGNASLLPSASPIDQVLYYSPSVCLCFIVFSLEISNSYCLFI